MADAIAPATNIKDHLKNAKVELELAAHAAQEGGEVYVDFEDAAQGMVEDIDDMVNELIQME